MKPKNTNFLPFVWYFYQATMYKKSEWYFFDRGSIDGKSEVEVEKRHLVVELKLKMLNRKKVTFSISTPPPGGAFELLVHFSHLWASAPKSIIQIFDTLSINKFHWNSAPCISGILKWTRKTSRIKEQETYNHNDNKQLLWSAIPFYLATIVHWSSLLSRHVCKLGWNTLFAYQCLSTRSIRSCKRAATREHFGLVSRNWNSSIKWGMVFSRVYTWKNEFMKSMVYSIWYISWPSEKSNDTLQQAFVFWSGQV